MNELTLEKANDIIAGAFAKASEMNLKPLGVSVLDTGGHMIVCQRQDGASFLRPEMSAGKAYGALALGMNSRALEGIAKERPHLMSGVADVSGGRIVAAAGGVLVKDKSSGAILGAVGISGDTSDADEAAAIAGIEGAGFVANSG